MAPEWRRDKGGTTEYDPCPIVDDMRIGVHNLLTLAEDVLIMWAIDHAAVPGLMEVNVVPEAMRNPACPIKYKMGIRKELFAGLPPATPPGSPGTAGGGHLARA